MTYVFSGMLNPTQSTTVIIRPHRSTTLVGCVAQWFSVGLSPANFRCPALDLLLMGDHLCG